MEVDEKNVVENRQKNEVLSSVGYLKLYFFGLYLP